MPGSDRSVHRTENPINISEQTRNRARNNERKIFSARQRSTSLRGRRFFVVDATQKSTSRVGPGAPPTPRHFFVSRHRRFMFYILL